ncbi:MAG TPA: DUF3775 domain-containing protein [Rhizomicrobium sp.]|jgi:hypothetical protein
MLQHLAQADIDAIIAACEQATAAATADPQSGELPLVARDHVYELVDALPRAVQEELLALMWTGGPKNHSSFEENLELVQKTIDDNHAEHLSEQAVRLPEYLRDGLKRINA